VAQLIADLDTFERELASSMWGRGGIVLSAERVADIAQRIPRHVDCSGTHEPLRLTRDSLQEAFRHHGLEVDDARCLGIAENLIPYIAVTDSNLD
jgi:hypothetical protein